MTKKQAIQLFNDRKIKKERKYNIRERAGGTERIR